MINLRLRTITIAFILLSLISGFLILLTYRIKPNPNIGNNLSEDKTYRFSPQEYPTVLSIGYPYVSTSPTNLIKSVITAFKERMDLADNRFNNLFFAAKRVEEMHAWKDELIINGNVTNMEEWWNTNEPQINRPDSFRIYNTWEAMLARYYVSMSKAIENKDIYEYSSDKNPSSLPLYVITFKKDIKLILENSQLKDKEKTYLLSLVDSIHYKLLSKLHYDSDLFINSEIPYQLYDIQHEKAYGIYDLSFPINASSIYLPEKIVVNNQTYPVNCSDKQCKATGIQIGKESTFLYLIYEGATSLLTTTHQDNTIIFKVPTLKFNQSTLALTTTGKSFELIIFESSKHQETLHQFTFPITNVPETYFFYIPSGDDQYIGTLKMNESSDESLEDFSIQTLPQLTNRVTLTYKKPLPGYTPSINVKYTGYNTYEINANHISKNQQQELRSLFPLWKIKSIKETDEGIILSVSYWPITIYTFIFLLSLCGLLLLSTHRILLRFGIQLGYLNFISKVETVTNTSIQKIIQGIWLIYKLLIRVRFLCLFFAFSLSAFITLFISYNSSQLILLLFFIWTVTIISFRFGSDFSFIFSFIMLVMLLLFSVLQQWQLSESFALFSFIFFSIGTLLGILENLLQIKGITLSNFHNKHFQRLKKSIQI